MSFRYLRIPALLILAIPLSAHAQSLGDLARQFRAEQQQSGASHPKVYTNDDLVSPSSNAPAAESGKQDGQPATTENTAEGAAKAADSKNGPSSDKNNEKERQARELELQKRTQEINQRYLDKITDIRTQIAAAQQEIARLQRDQVESTNQFQRTSGTTPNVAEYQDQQRLFTEQITAQRDLIVSLTSQLEDAQEAARHAGVPHATD